MVLPHLVAELADGEDLLHPGRRRGHEVEAAGQRPDAGQQRHAQLERQVLAQRVLGVHGHGRQPVGDLAGARRPAARSRRRRPGCPWRRPRTTSVRRPAAPRAGRARPAMVVLPTPPLPVTKTSRRSSSGRVNSASRSRSAGRRRAGRPRRRPAWRSGTAIWRPRPVGEPQHLVALGEGGVDLRPEGVTDRCRRRARALSSRGAWVTPMRTSTYALLHCASRPLILEAPSTGFIDPATVRAMQRPSGRTVAGSSSGWRSPPC